MFYLPSFTFTLIGLQTSMDDMLDRDGFVLDHKMLSSTIEAYHDHSSSTIYLNFTSVLDKSNLMHLIMSATPESLDNILSREEALELQCLLYLFMVSNVILIATSTLSIEMDWINTLKTLGAMKRAIMPELSDYLDQVFSQNRIVYDALKSSYCPGRTSPWIAFVINIQDYIRRQETEFKVDMTSLENQVRAFMKYTSRSGQCKNLFALDPNQISHLVSLSNNTNMNAYNLLMGYTDEKPYGVKALRSWIIGKTKLLYTQPRKSPESHNHKGKKERFNRPENLEWVSSRIWFAIAEKIKYYLLEEKLEAILNVQ